MIRYRNLAYPLVAVCLALGFTACTESEDEKPDDTVPKYTIPSDYSTFEGVDFAGQTARLDMLGELGKYAKSGKDSSVKLDAAKMKAMWANSGNPFPQDGLNTSGKKLKDKTFQLDTAYFIGLMDSAAAASGDSVPAKKGKSGVITTSDGKGKYLVSAQGHEYAQLLEKGLMGAVAYYQATSVYLDSTGKLEASLSDSVKAHHWDEAFGYYTSSVKYPAEGKDRFWSKYANDHDKLIGCNAKILRAFTKGRAAIVNKDRKAMLEAIDSVRQEWEKVVAASAIHYFNAVKKALTDDGARSHQLSEAIAFSRALKYNAGRKITEAQLKEIEEKIGSDFYEVTLAGLDGAINLLSGIYGFDSIKDQL